MRISVKILGVKDGDAIIITLQKEKKNLIMLIDSGEKSYSARVISELEKVLAKFSKTAPDLVVCTHYDSDHIGGMKDIILHFVKKGSKPGKVWLHKPNPAIEKLFSDANAYLQSKSKHVMKMYPLILEGIFEEAGIINEAENLIESVSQLSSLVHMLIKEKISIQEPFAGNKFLPEWPEIEVIGPSTSFFRQTFPSGITTENFVKDEVDFNLLCESKSLKNDKLTHCHILDLNANKKGVSKTNMASIIICITVDGKKFLFTGDADIKSFESINNYREKLSNIHFLKIPHHASRNNLSSELISIMKPNFAYVSGDKYADEEVIGCLKAHKAEVRVTNDPENDLVFSFGK